jgi:hypothetical protein
MLTSLFRWTETRRRTGRLPLRGFEVEIRSTERAGNDSLRILEMGDPFVVLMMGRCEVYVREL